VLPTRTEVRAAAHSVACALPPPPGAVMRLLPPGASPAVVSLCGAALASAALLAGTTAAFLAARRAASAAAGAAAGGDGEGGDSASGGGGGGGWFGGGGSADADAAADAVANLQRRVRNVQSALAVMPADWAAQRAPLEGKLTQLTSELATALARAAKAGALPTGLDKEWAAARTAHGAAGAADALAAALAASAAGTAALLSPASSLPRVGAGAAAAQQAQQAAAAAAAQAQFTRARGGSASGGGAGASGGPLGWLGRLLSGRGGGGGAGGVGFGFGGGIGLPMPRLRRGVAGSLSDRASLLERRLEALEALQLARGAADGAAAAAAAADAAAAATAASAAAAAAADAAASAAAAPPPAWARASAAQLAALEARVNTLGTSFGGAPWEAGDRAIQKHLSLVQAALAARQQAEAATLASATAALSIAAGDAAAAAAAPALPAGSDAAAAAAATAAGGAAPAQLPPPGDAAAAEAAPSSDDVDAAGVVSPTAVVSPAAAAQAEAAAAAAAALEAANSAGAAVIALEARVDYLSAVLCAGGAASWAGEDVSSRLIALEASAAAQAAAASAHSAQLEAASEAMRAAVVQLQAEAAAERAAARANLAALTVQLAATEEALMTQLQAAQAAAALPAAAGGLSHSASLPTAPHTLAAPASSATQNAPVQTAHSPADAEDAKAADPSASRMEQGREIILQGFNWESHHAHGGAPLFRRLRDRVADVAGLGFTAVWLPPACQSLAPQGYLPQDFYNLNSAYGSEKELRELLRDMLEAGLLPLADVVLNHRCATRRGRERKWNRYDGIPMPWDESCVTRNNGEWAGTGGWGTGEEFPIAPNIDHTNERVRADLRAYLAWLRTDVGFRGLRLDFVKGYGAAYAADYINAFNAEFAVGELWQSLSYADGQLEYNQDAHRQAIVDWVDATRGVATAFDFTTKGVLQEACGRGEWWRLRDSGGRPPGVLGLWPSRAVTFIDNHDTGSTQAHWPFPAERVTQGYAYILTHPGTPSVLWDHLFDWGEDVKRGVRALVAARRAGGVTSRSRVAVQKADGECYAATVGTRLAVRLGGGTWAPHGNGWQHACSGGNGSGHWCVWLKPE
jgi:alpha-amylase